METKDTQKPKIPLKQVFKAYKRLLGESLRANKKAFIAVSIVSIITALLPLINNLISSKVIDEIIRLLAIQVSERIYDSLIYLIIISVVISLGLKTAWAISSYIQRIIHFDLDRYYSFRFIEKSSQLDISHFENEKTSNIIEKARDVHDWRTREASYRFVWIFYDLVRLISTMIAVLSFSFWAFLLVAATTIPRLIGNAKLGKQTWGIWDANATDRKKYWWTKHNLHSEKDIKEIRIFQSANYLLTNIKNIYNSFINKERKNALKRTIIESILGNISEIGITVFWILSIIAVLNGQLTIGLLSFYTAAMYQFSGSLNDLVRRLSESYEDSLYVIDFFTFIDLENKVKDGTKTITSSPPVIEFKNVSFKYPGEDKYIIEHLNMTIHPKEKVAFVGVNGAGKSTLIKLLCRFYDVTDGEILINGIPITEISLSDWYSKIGVLFQDFVTYGQFSVRQNIEIGNTNFENDSERLESSVFKSDAKSFIEEYKFKYDQLLNKGFEDGINPSGGQWQRIALARAFYRDAPILILDEPTSAIDAKGESEIFERLFEFSKDKTVLIISHRFSTVRKADKIFVVESGKIIEEGSHSELMKIGAKYAEAFGLQAEGYK